MLFDPAALHTSDQRPLSVRFSVGVSKQFGVDSLWMQTPAARGHLGPQVTLIRPCNMRQPASADRGGIGEIKLTPRDRSVQLGEDALSALLDGLPLAAMEQPADPGCGGSHAKKVLVFHLQPGEFGELAHATLTKILQAEAQNQWADPRAVVQGPVHRVR